MAAARVGKCAASILADALQAGRAWDSWGGRIEGDGIQRVWSEGYAPYWVCVSAVGGPRVSRDARVLSFRVVPCRPGGEERAYMYWEGLVGWCEGYGASPAPHTCIAPLK